MRKGTFAANSSVDYTAECDNIVAVKKVWMTLTAVFIQELHDCCMLKLPPAAVTRLQSSLDNVATRHYSNLTSGLKEFEVIIENQSRQA